MWPAAALPSPFGFQAPSSRLLRLQSTRLSDSYRRPSASGRPPGPRSAGCLAPGPDAAALWSLNQGEARGIQRRGDTTTMLSNPDVDVLWRVVLIAHGRADDWRGGPWMGLDSGYADLSVIAVPMPCAEFDVRYRALAPPCPPGARYEFETTRPARFLGDSGLRVHPLPTERRPRNLVSFVVDTNGAVLPETFKVIVVTDHDVVESARGELGQWRFSPAMIGDCRVRQLVQTPIGGG